MYIQTTYSYAIGAFTRDMGHKKTEVMQALAS
jgi:hypothetical protein